MEFSWQLPVLDEEGPFILGGVLVLLYLLELIIPLRQWHHRKFKRYFQNISLSIIGMPMARLLLLPITFFWAGLMRQNEFGVLNWLELPNWLNLLLGILALDYGIYIWHRLNHIWPFLWRFHNVHHIDLDMDVSTAIRFHFGEMLLSIPFRILVIAAFGVQPMTILYYEVVFEAATLFHHSNIRLPRKLERLLALFIITPRQHGIHHSIIQQETNSNYGTVFNVWDKLHTTSVMNIPQSKITIGVPAYLDEKEHYLKNLLLMPFGPQRPWQKSNGEVPQRPEQDKTEKLR